MNNFIPIAQPTLNGNEKAYVLDCLDSNWISSQGAYIERFESQFAQYHEVKHALTCCNGTVALHLALLAVGVGPGDEVLVPTLTFVASANAVIYCGARPVFVDSDPHTWNIDVAAVEASITPKTKAIMAVHLYGQPADLSTLRAIADRHNIFLIEDAAEAHGARFAGVSVGAWGDIGTFSFYGNKIITTGEGGMVVTRNDDLAARVRHLKSQGMDPKRRYWFTEVGYNYRMTNIAAALGLAQLEKIDSYLAEREALWSHYQRELMGVDGISFQGEADNVSSVRWMINVLLDEKIAAQRDAIMIEMREDGVETRPVFPPIHTLPPYSAPGLSFPVAERLGAAGITLPTWVGLGQQGVERVCASLRQRLATCSSLSA